MIELKKEPKIEMTPNRKALMRWDKACATLKTIVETPVDFNDWIKISLWSLEESIALLLARNPEVVKWHELHEFIAKNVGGIFGDKDEDDIFFS